MIKEIIDNIAYPIIRMQKNVQYLFKTEYDTVNINDNIHIKQILETNDLYTSINGFLNMLASYDIENIVFDHEPFKLSSGKTIKNVNTKSKTFTVIDHNNKRTKIDINDLNDVISVLNGLNTLFKISKDTYTMFFGFLGADDGYRVYDNPHNSFDYHIIKKWRFK